MNRSSTIQCKEAAQKASASLDGQLTPQETRDFNVHLRQCPGCAESFRFMVDTRAAMRSMPQRVPPPVLRTRLQVVASHERARHTRLSTWQSRLDSWRTDARLCVQNLMRPFALPAFGGFASAIVLFSMLAASPAFAVRGVSPGHDVPTCLYTEATVVNKTIMPVSFVDDDVVVDVTVDREGRLIDYEITDCEHVAKSPALRKEIERNLLFTEFLPATYFGHTVRAKLRISFLNSRIDVRG